MKRVLTILIILLINHFVTRSQSVDFEWAKTSGGSSADFGQSICVDAIGNIYNVGYFRGTVDFDPGTSTTNLISAGIEDVFIQKLNPDGDLIWAKSFGGASNDQGLSTCVDSIGNVYITGVFSGSVDFDPGPGTNLLNSASGLWDIFIIKMGANGNFIWARSFGGTAVDISRSIAIHQSGYIYTTGEFTGTVDFDPGTGVVNLSSGGLSDVFVHKLDTSGNFVWARSFEGDSIDYGSAICVDSVGNVYTAGDFGGSIDFDPGVGTDIQSSNGYSDMFVQKMDANGNYLWANSFGGIYEDFCKSLSVDLFGNTYTTGSYIDSVDFDPGQGTTSFISPWAWNIFVQKMNSNGNFQWARSFGENYDDQGLSIFNDTEGNVYTAGTFGGTVDFDPGIDTTYLIRLGGWGEVFVQKMDSSGNFAWAKALQGTSHNVGKSITVDLLGNVYTTGHFHDSTDFDPDTGTTSLASNGGADVFVHKLSQCNGITTIDYIVSCDSYTWIDGNIYTESNDTVTYVLTSNSGCASTVTLNLTIGNLNSGSEDITECDGYLWSATSATYNTSGTYTALLTNSSDCDSIATLNLTINNATSGSEDVIECDRYTWDANNITYDASGTHTALISNISNCDSIATLNLTITETDTSVVQIGDVLTAQANGVTYQWVDCDNNTILINETNQSYSPTVSGNYAVILTENNCIDTSLCFSISNVGIVESNFPTQLSVYPNPFTDKVSLDLGARYKSVRVTVIDIRGKIILSKSYNDSQFLNLKIEEPSGVYLLNIESGDKKAVIRLIKE